MRGGAADERQKRVVPHLEAHPSHGLPIPDELLWEILLRLPTPADLVRAAAACVSFRRVAADRAFLRRYRKLHAPPFIGFLDERLAFHPVVATHPCAPPASAADFSFSFLPAPARDWFLADSRDGRVLLERRRRAALDRRVAFKEYMEMVQDSRDGPVLLARRRDAIDRRAIFKETVVCDPLRRRYLLLPPIPDDMIASVVKWQRSPLTFLAPPADDEEDEASFRVICMVECKLKLFAFVFSSTTRQWRTVPSRSWSDLLPGLSRQIRLKVTHSSRYAYGCFYWMIQTVEMMTHSTEDKMLVLDTQRMEFSIAELPPEAKEMLDMAMVEAGDGIPEMFVLARDTTDFTTIRQYSGDSSGQWKSEKTISLDYGYGLVGSVARYLLLYWFAGQVIKPCHFTLDIKTFQLEKVCASTYPNLYTYSNLPPMFSAPTISSGNAKGAENAALEQDTGLLQDEAHSRHDKCTADPRAGAWRSG